MKKFISFFVLIIALVQLVLPLVFLSSRTNPLPRNEIIPDEPIRHNPELKTNAEIINYEPIHHDLKTSLSSANNAIKQELKYPKRVMWASAYYKPSPNQKKFRLGNYKAEVFMNGSGKRTSTGKEPRYGIIAASKKDFLPGSILRVDGYGYCTVEDSGKAVTRNRIDLFMGVGDEGRQKAVQWGVRKVNVEIVQLGKKR